MSKMVNLTGLIVDNITVLELSEIKKEAIWKCLCKCGVVFLRRRSSILDKRGTNKSCGCLRRQLHSKLHRTHGMGKTKIYAIWQGMKRRCLNPNEDSYKRYGAVGITVCERWLKFENFLEDMGEIPQDKRSIDRINNAKGYSKDNCRWASFKEQAQNTSRNVFFELNGERLCLADWARRIGIGPSALLIRLQRWPLEKALTKFKYETRRSGYKD